MNHHRDTESTEKKMEVQQLSPSPTLVRCLLTARFFSSTILLLGRSSLCPLCLCGYFLFTEGAAAGPALVPVEGPPLTAEFIGVGPDGVLKFQPDQPADANSPQNAMSLKIEDLVQWGRPARPRPHTLV